MQGAANEARLAIKRGGCFSQAEKSALGRGQKPTDTQAKHLDGCSGCSGYVSAMKEQLGKVERR